MGVLLLRTCIWNFFPYKGKSIELESSDLAKLTCIDGARLIISELQLHVANRECHFSFHVHRMIDWEFCFISRHPVGQIANFHDHQGMKQMGDEWKHYSRGLIDNAKYLGIGNLVLRIVVTLHSHSTFVYGKYFVRAQYCVRAQCADCALTKYCFPAKFASSQNILYRHNISIFLYFVPTQYGAGIHSCMDKHGMTVKCWWFNHLNYS